MQEFDQNRYVFVGLNHCIRMMNPLLETKVHLQVINLPLNLPLNLPNISHPLAGKLEVQEAELRLRKLSSPAGLLQRPNTGMYAEIRMYTCL